MACRHRGCHANRATAKAGEMRCADGFKNCIRAHRIANTGSCSCSGTSTDAGAVAGAEGTYSLTFGEPCGSAWEVIAWVESVASPALSIWDMHMGYASWLHPPPLDVNGAPPLRSVMYSTHLPPSRCGHEPGPEPLTISVVESVASTEHPVRFADTPSTGN